MAWRVMIAEDHAFTLEGMAHALGGSDLVEVCATVRGGVAAIAQARLHRPDVALLDFSMPDATGIEVFDEIGRWSPATRCIIVTGTANAAVLARILDAGVAGLFTKACPIEAVIDGIDRVALGERVVSDAIRELLDSTASGEPHLTGRERQILHAIARGRTNLEMAGILGISAKTVDTHRMSLMRKMRVNSAPALVRTAIRTGLIEP